MKRVSRRELLRWAAVAAGSSTLARLPSGILLADASPNSPLGELLDGQALQAESQSKSGPEKDSEKGTGSDARLLLPISFSKTVLRADDLLSLRFDFSNLVRSGNQLVQQIPSVPGYVIVRFPPQHIAEEAYLEAEGTIEPVDAPGGVSSRMAKETRLAFIVPVGVTIPYTLDGLLDWATWGQQRVVEAATPPEYVKVEPGPTIVEPATDETAIEAPWRVTLSPHTDAGWAHATQPVTHDSRTELWHTRLGERKTDASGPHVDEHDPARRTVRAIWSPDYNKNSPPPWTNKGPFRTSLSPRDRHDIVRLTSDYATSGYNPKPIEVNNLMLSSLGAWIDSVGNWDFLSDTKLDHWRQRGTMGRDHYVRVVYPGYLAPFGHPAVLTKITERKFHQAPGNGPAAYLLQRLFIVVLRPEVTNTSRRLPFKSIRVTNLVSPLLDPTDDPTRFLIPNGEAFWPYVAGTDHLWTIVGTDADGQRTEFSMPLAFVLKDVVQGIDGDAGRTQVAQAYDGANNQANLSRRKRLMHGQRIAYAPSTPASTNGPAKPGDTSLDTVSFTFGMEPIAKIANSATNPGPFRGTMSEAGVRLAGVDQATGKASGGSAPVRIELHPTYINDGMPLPTDGSHPNLGAMFAKLVAPAPINFPGDRSGGVITPNMQITGLSRVLGPTGGNPAAVDGILTGKFKPDDFFGGAAPKILGGISLADVIAEVTGGYPQSGFASDTRLPRIVSVPVYQNDDSTQPARYVDTKMIWSPEVKTSTKPGTKDFFVAKPGATLNITARTLTKLAGPLPSNVAQFSIAGELTNFKVQLIPTIQTFLILDFNRLRFAAEAGTKPDIEVDIQEVAFAGPLEFVNKLRHYLGSDALNGAAPGYAMASTLASSDSAGPGIDVRPDGITLSYALGLPAIGLGVFALKNISLGAELNLPFTDDPMRLRFKFCDRADPGQVSVSLFSGTFFFSLALGLGSIEGFEAQIEFGGDLSIDLGVASGGVYVLAGIYYGMEDEQSELTGYVRLGGELDILGLISVSLEFYLGLSYLSAPDDQLWGQASLTIEVEVAMFSESVEVSVERRFAGSGDTPPGASLQGLHGRAAPLLSGSPGAPLSPTFEDLVPTPQDWADYCKAFA